MVLDISAKMFSNQITQRGKAGSDSHSRPNTRLGGHRSGRSLGQDWARANGSRQTPISTDQDGRGSSSGLCKQRRAVRSSKQNSEDEVQDRAKRRGGE